MSIQISQTESTHLLITTALNTGYLQKEIEHLSSYVDKKPLDKDLFETRCAKISELNARLEMWSKMYQISKQNLTTDAAAQHFFSSLMFTDIEISLIDSQSLLRNMVSCIFNAIHDKVEKKFRHTIDQLNQFRKNPTEENLDKANEAVEKLCARVTLFRTLSQRSHIKLSEEQQKTVAKIESVSDNLYTLISPSSLSVLPPLLNRLSILCHKEAHVSLQEKIDFGSAFDWHVISILPQTDQKALDGRINELSTPKDRNKKSPLLNRYDNLKLFEQAFTEMIQKDVERALQTDENGPKLSETEMKLFYSKLHELAFGPEGVDSTTWAKQELPKLKHLFFHALQELHSPSDTVVKEEIDIETLLINPNEKIGINVEIVIHQFPEKGS